jgi:hypothetical protein
MKSLLDLLVPPPPVRRFGDTYAVEASGRVWSLHNPGTWFVPKTNRKGYVVLPDKTLVHELVATLWIGPRPDGDSIAVHIDGNKLNNAVENICWKNKNV